MTKSSTSIAIIGGGFCGIMTLIHLIRRSPKPVHISVFNIGYPEGRGIAYNTYSDKHVLNVPCSNMSAFVDQPDHFLNWVKATTQSNLSNEELAGKFLPRNLYGQYVEELYKQTLNELPSHIELEVINEEVIDLDKSDTSYSIKTNKGRTVAAHKVVLATGNHVPSAPPLKDRSGLNSPMFFGNPWSEQAVAGINDSDPILIIGTGLTMVDIVLGLQEKKFGGKIIALSPNGFNILAHKKHHPQRFILDELEPPFDLNSLFKLFYKHVRNARKNGESGETVVDAVRNKTQEIWQHLSLADKKRFMTHLRHLWGVARHRLPGEIHSQIQQLINDKKLEIVAGRIDSISVSGNQLKVDYRERGNSELKNIFVQRAINCTGPQTDIEKFKGSLYASLIKKGLVKSDDMHLGIHATSDGRIIDHSGEASDTLFTIGSLLKGQLWESTAVPELRVQADRLAGLLIG
jgi:uncharacterized NAD(P)/FAD-binding protein YdhS